MTKIKGTLLVCDTPNRNGRIYPEEAVREALAKYKETHDFPVPGGIVDDVLGIIRIEDTAFTIDSIELVGKNLLYKGSLMGTPKGKAIRQCGISSFGCCLQGMGTIEDNVVKEFTIASVGLRPLKECAWPESQLTEEDEQAKQQ